MKYPKPWEAGWPAGHPYVASYREGARAGQIQVATYVNRPDTPDHTRLVRTWLTLVEAERLRDELALHIDMMRRLMNARPCFRCGALATEPHRNAECNAELAEAR